MSKKNLEQAPEAPRAPEQHQKPADVLREIFFERKAKNPAYSTRAYARDLGISQALLSLVLNGKRPVTVKQAAQIAALLGFAPERAEAFLASALLSLPSNAKAVSRLKRMQKTGTYANPQRALFVSYDMERYKAISQWYHLAILDLTTTTGFKSESSWIAERLGISGIEATDAIERLLTLGLLIRENGALRKANSKIYFATQKSEAAVRSFHRQMIGKAVEQLDKTSQEDFAAREISSITMAIPKSSVAMAKQRIRDFQKDLASLLNAGACIDAAAGPAGPALAASSIDEVYQFNVQFFPLTERELKPGVSEK